MMTGGNLPINVANTKSLKLILLRAVIIPEGAKGSRRAISKAVNPFVAL